MPLHFLSELGKNCTILLAPKLESKLLCPRGLEHLLVPKDSMPSFVHTTAHIVSTESFNTKVRGRFFMEIIHV